MKTARKLVAAARCTLYVHHPSSVLCRSLFQFILIPPDYWLALASFRCPKSPNIIGRPYPVLDVLKFYHSSHTLGHNQ